MSASTLMGTTGPHHIFTSEKKIQSTRKWKYGNTKKKTSMRLDKEQLYGGHDGVVKNKRKKNQDQK